jgi:hypothetical protein
MGNANAVEITDDIFNQVCNDMSNSPQGLTHILKPYGINRSSFLEYKEKEPHRINTYTRAKSDQLEYLACEINRLTYEMEATIRGDNVYNEININAAVKVLQIQIDALKWLLSKLAPKEYGDKIQVDSDVKTTQIFKIGDKEIFM